MKPIAATLLLLTACTTAPRSTSGGEFIKGMDISSVIALEEAGAKFKNASGIEEDVFKILADNGVNAVRFRIWNDPNSSAGIKGGGNNDLAKGLAIARRAKARGMKICVDFHYSDSWADPSQQVLPASWQAYTTRREIKNALYSYTKSALQSFNAQNTPPDYVQVGNEISSGFLWYDKNNPSDKRWAKLDNWAVDMPDFIDLLKDGIRAVRETAPGAKIILQTAKADQLQWFFPYMDRAGLDYDIMGASYYPFMPGSGSKTEFASYLAKAAALNNKPIMIMEYSYAHTLAAHADASNIFGASSAAEGGYPATPEGQSAAIKDILQTVKSARNGAGAWYWEPAWIPIAGVGWGGAGTKSSWANQALFDYNGKALSSLQIYKEF